MEYIFEAIWYVLKFCFLIGAIFALGGLCIPAYEFKIPKRIHRDNVSIEEECEITLWEMRQAVRSKFVESGSYQEIFENSN